MCLYFACILKNHICSQHNRRTDPLNGCNAVNPIKQSTNSYFVVGMVNTHQGFTWYNNSGDLCLEVFNLKIAIIDDEEKDREEVKDALIPYLHTLDFKTELCEYKSA